MLAVLLALLAAAGTAHTGHGHGNTGAAVQENPSGQGWDTGWFTPDSSLYGIEVAWDRVGMAVGLANAGDVAQKRANEAQAMAAKGDWEAAQRAANGLETAAARAGDDDVSGLEQAMSTLEGVMADAPEEAQDGLQTAMDRVQQAGPGQLPDQASDGPSDTPGQDTDDQPQPDNTGPDTAPDTDAGNDSDTGTGDTSPGPFPADREGPENEIVTVLLEDSSFGQDVITAKPGQDIVFRNMDSVDHTVTIASEGIDETLGPRDRFVLTLDETGEYDLNCTFHPGMDATIVIEE